MAKKRYSKRKAKRLFKKAPVLFVLLIVCAAIGLLLFKYGDKLFDTEVPSEPTVDDGGVTVDGGEVSFHIIDVGQGDAILIKTQDGNMLIDSGDLDSESHDKLISYLEEQKVTAFEYVVFTHPDSDHIGSADHIVKNYDVKTVIMTDFEKTTAVYGRLIDAIEEKEVDLILIGEDSEVCEQSGYKFALGPITNTVMAPTEDFKDANEMSIVIKSVYGETSILFTGDAETESETAMLKMYTKGELDCDILKVGHHGANTSSGKSFLEAVSPEAALISCGEGNTYGHPTSGTLDKLNDINAKIYRTDNNGSIVITTDGVAYEITTEK